DAVRHKPLVDEPSVRQDALPGPDQDCFMVLHEEISRLPDRYRLPVVLCDLQGNTSEEAARGLGIPAGTVRRRLFQVRKVLGDRLGRRGVTLSGSVVPALLAQETVRAAVPERLLLATINGTFLLMQGKPVTAGLLAGSALGLADQVVRQMAVRKWGWIIGVSLALAGVGVT